MHTPQRAAPRHWKRRLLVIAVVGLAFAALAHRPLLAAFYRGLLWQDPLQPVTYVVLLHSDPTTVNRAGQLHKQGIAQEILVLERRPPRVVQIGILPRMGDTVRRDLQADGIPTAAIRVVATDAVTHWQSIRQLRQVLQSETKIATKISTRSQPAVQSSTAVAAPTPTVAVLYPEHQTRYLRSIIDRAVPDDQSRRIRVWGCSPGSFGASTWWQQRGAIVKVGVAYLRFVHSLGFGEGDFNTDTWNLRQYERSLGLPPSTAAAAA